MALNKYISCVVVVLILTLEINAQEFIFVKHDAGGNNDGTSWINAHTGLEPALAAASPGSQIWVAAGTYEPVNEVGGTGVHFRTFQLKNGVSVYGGFAGTENPATFNLNDRDLLANETILSGATDNVYHVFRHVNTGLDNTAVLDGFTISGGMANGPETIDRRGGGMLNSGSNADNGSSPTIRNCTFKNNAAEDGGALYNSRFSNPSVSHSTFENNAASRRGGAVFNFRNNTVFDHCTFVGNTVSSTDGTSDGGGAIYTWTSIDTEGVIVSNSVFINNSSPDSRGGALHKSINPGYCEVINSEFYENNAHRGGAAFFTAGSSAAASNSDVLINGSLLNLNTASDLGGGIFVEQHELLIASTQFRGNKTLTFGGAHLYMMSSALTTIVNSLFAGGKTIGNDGAILHHGSHTEIINTTISGNYTTAISLGIGTSSTIRNSIIWGNVSSTSKGNNFRIRYDATLTLDHSLYGNEAGDIFLETDHPSGSDAVLEATNSVTGNPFFMNFVAPVDDNTPNTLGDYLIKNLSPALDAGLNGHVPDTLSMDLRGSNRIVDGSDNTTATVDMGAYEYDPDNDPDSKPAGDGTADAPYQLTTLDHLNWISQNENQWDKHYILIAHIDASDTRFWNNGSGWLPIGYGQTWPFAAGQGFTGTFNGNGYTINGLFINRATINDAPVGLFAICTDGARIENIGLTDVEVIGDAYVGSLAGYVGLGDRVEIRNSYSTGSVAGRFGVGGLIGVADNNALIEESYSEVDVTGQHNQFGVHQRIGGFVGQMQTNPDTAPFAEVRNCYAGGSVTSVGYAWGHHTGGFVGRNYRSKVINSYAKSIVDIDFHPNDPSQLGGGFTGSISAFAAYEDTGNFFDTQATGQTSTAGNAEGKSTDEMKNPSTFVNEGWDFNTTWSMLAGINDGYPYLQWHDDVLIEAAWTGNSNADWHNAANWDAETVPGYFSSVAIPNVANQPVIAEGAYAQAKSIAIESGGGLSINQGAALTVAENLVNNGTLNLRSGDNGDGSLIIGGEITGEGSFNVERYLLPEADYEGGGRWHLVSTPIVNATASVFMGMVLFEHIEAVFDWEQSITSPTEPLIPGKGYLLRTETSETRTFSGMINQGEIGPIALSRNNVLPVDQRGWNLVGNPYPSAIDWDAEGGWTKTNVDDAVYVWNNNQYASYINGLATNGGSRYIAMGQGFFVRVSVDGASISMNNNARVHEAIFLKNEMEPPKNLLRVIVRDDQNADETLIYYSAAAKDTYDGRHDAAKLFGSEHAPQIYTKKHESKTSIHSINETGLLNEKYLYVEVGESTEYTIHFSHSFAELEGLVMKNLLTNQVIQPGENHAFFANPSDASKRFQFIADMDAISDISAWSHGRKLFVEIPHHEYIKNIAIYNVSGSRVMQSRTAETDLSALSAGVYVVRVQTGTETVAVKIII